MRVKRITSPQNPTVKALARLKLRRQRERERRYLLEGSREVERAAQAGVRFDRLILCPKLMNAAGRALAKALRPEAEMLELAQAAFAKLSYRDNPDGLLAVARMRELTLPDLKLPENALLLILSGLEKPGNLGALLRTADGANLSAVFISGGGADLYNPNVIRASMGSLFSRPVVTLEEAEVQTWLSAQRIQLIAATPDAEASYWEADYTPATAIVLGAEHEGLSESWRKAADTAVSIPTNGLADSLNVATAGALLVYEALRQRRLSSSGRTAPAGAASAP
jgi:TrmH family RNA methyltransferase